MFRYGLSAAFSTLHLKKNFRIDYLQDIEIITRDYSGSLKNILKSFASHRVNLSSIETRKLNRHYRYLASLILGAKMSS